MFGQWLQHLPFEEVSQAQLRMFAQLLALMVLYLLGALGQYLGCEQQSQTCCESHKRKYSVFSIMSYL